MKKAFLLISLVILFVSNGFSQTTVTIQPNVALGKDAMVQWRTNTAYADTNYGWLPSYEAVAWTWSGKSGVVRSLLQFDLSSIPANVMITDAKLSLYNDPTSAENGGQHSSL